MPYIKKEDRKKFDSVIEDVVDALTEHGFKPVSVGELNYVISKIIWGIFDKNPSYTIGNNFLGTLTAVQLEFYRRKLGPYEDVKIKENGDI